MDLSGFKDGLEVIVPHPLTIRVPISGYPTPHAKWSFADKELTAGERVYMITKSTYVELTVTPSVRPDRGVYALTLENDITSCSGEIEVNVIASPSAPKDFKVAEVTRQHVHLMWEAPEHDGGSPLTGYQIEKRDVSRKTWVKVITGVQDQEFTVTDVVEGKEYLFRVTACNKCGPGEPAYIDEPVNVSSPATVPDSPENLKWRDKTASGIFLTWEPPKWDGGTGIRGYNIERCQRGTDNWESCGDQVPEFKLQVTGLIEGQWYAYRVKALNRLGASKPCKATDEILAVDPKDPPEILLDVKCLAGLTVKAGSKIELPADVLGKPVPKVKWTKGDVVLKGDDRVSIDDKPGHSVITISKTTREDTATYIIEAHNSCGRATATIDVNILDKPGPPAAFDISEITNKSCFLAWNPPRDDGGAKVTNYIVESRAVDSEIWHKLSSTVKETNYKALNLTAFKEYIFRVFAENQFGIGVPAEHMPIIARYAFDSPGAPTKLEPSDIVKDGLTLNWYEPEEDGGSPITGYWVERFEPDQNRWIRCNKIPIIDTTYRVKGLPTRKKYKFRVMAENLAGPGKSSKETDQILVKDPIDPPWAPGKPTVKDVAKTSAFLQWTKPEHDGGAKIEGYIIELLKSGTEQWVRVSEGINILEHSLRGLMDRQEYSFRVLAVNIAGESEPSDPSDPVLCKERLNPPTPPRWMNVITVTRNSAELKWTVPEKDGGSPITNYIVEKRDVRRKGWQTVDTTVKELKYTVTPLNEGSLYVFRVAAENAVGPSEFCELEDSIMAKDTYTTPGPPYNLSVNGVSKRHVDLQWDAPKNDGGRPVLRYSIEKKEKLGTRWVKCGKTSGDDCKYRVTDVIEGTEVQFQVRAENEAGAGHPSESTEIIAIEDPTGVPSPPIELHITEASRDHLCVAWRPPERTGGSAVTGYHIELCEAGTEKWMRINSRPIKELKYKTEEGITPEKQYVLRVRAINSVGVSEPSDISEKVYAKDPDCIPTLEFQTKDIVIVEGEKWHLPIPFRAVPKPKITWHKDGKELKDDERMSFRQEYLSCHLEIESCLHSDSGQYKVTLENSLGASSGTINVKVVGLPGPCKDIVASEITKSSCKVSWDPPNYDGGSPVLHYVLQRREAGRRTYVNMMSGENKVSWPVKDLIPNGEYYFQVKAVNKIGGGEYLELRNPVIAEDQKQSPDPPLDVETHNPTSKTITLTWKPPMYDGGCKIMGYVLEMMMKGDENFTRCNDFLVPVLSYTVRNLREGKQYQFRVRAENAAGVSDPSRSTPMVKASDAVETPKVFLSGSLQSGMSIKRGAQIRLGANISGSPYPQITWYRNDIVIRPEAMKKRPEKPIVKKKKEEKKEVKEGEKKEGEVKEGEKKEVKDEEKKEVKEGEVEVPATEAPAAEPAPEEPEEEELPDYPTLQERLTIHDKKRGESSCIVRDTIRGDHGVYTIKVENDHGIASATCEVNVLDAPGPAINFRFEEIRKNSVICKWDPPMDDGGSDILNYTLEKKDNSKVEIGWITVTSTLRGCRYPVTKLIEKKEYIFRVTAENKFGPGPPCISKPLIAKNPFDPPEGPGKPEIDGITANSMLVSWEEPSDMGSPILGYWVERREINSTHWTRVNRVILEDTELNVEGLLEGLTYIFRVAAENQAGPGKFSIPSDPMTCQDPILPPGPPFPRITDTTESSIDVEWDPPASNGGGDILGYHVDKTLAGTKDWSRSTERPWKTRVFTVYGVREGAKYLVRVIAVNGAGEGTPGLTESVFVRDPKEAPVVELDLTVRNGVMIRAGEPLILPALVTGRPPPDIKWTKDDGPPDKNHVEIENVGKESILSIKAATRKDPGKYQISARNNSGIKSTWTRVEVMDVPGPVLDLKPVVVTRKLMILNWSDPDDDGGSDLTGFIIERRDPKMHTWRQPIETPSSKCEIVGIVEGQEYIFRVVAKNKFGCGPPVDLGPIAAVDPKAPPTSPERFHYTERTKTSISLAWRPPRNEGGSPILGYFVEKKKHDAPAFEPCNTEMCKDLFMTVENLEELFMYEFRVKAVNLIGSSEPGIPLTIVIQDDELPPTVRMLKTFKGDAITVKKGEPIEIPAEVTGLPMPKVEWLKDEVIILEPTETLLMDTKEINRMQCNTKLSIPAAARLDKGIFTVIASNRLGSASHTIKVKVLDRPLPPRNVNIGNIKAESCYLTWDAPEDDGGSELTNYIVEKLDILPEEEPEEEYEDSEDEEPKPKPEPRPVPVWTVITNSIIEKRFGVWNLETGSQCQFRVRAENRYGQSDACETEATVIKDLYGLPGTPEKPQIAEHTRSSMLVTWDPPRDNGGSTISGYWLEKREKGSSYWARVNKAPVTKRAPKRWEFQVVRMIEGSAYEFRVMAVNIAGIGPPSGPSDPAYAVDPLMKPGMPAPPEVADKTKHSVSLTWSPPEKDGGSSIKGYIVEIQDEASSVWNRITDLETLHETTEITVPSLKELKHYKFRVTAVNDIGESDPSPKTEVLIEDVHVEPKILIDCVVEDLLCVRAGHSFRIPAIIKGRPVPKVTWEFTGPAKTHKKNRLHVLPVDSELESTDTTANITVPVCLRTHSGRYTITAKNKAGQKHVNVRVNVLDVPGAPRELKVTDITRATMRLIWKLPANDGGERIKSYFIEKKNVTGKAWTIVNQCCFSQAYVVEGLLEGQEYVFRVRAENRLGMGPLTETTEPARARDPICKFEMNE
ncbi:titin-like [Oncorhynchus nerka]|uniref:titin-like n=1 Tax=Oncorhynchus nerka TaxID=8023 RepID=UPI0031B86DBF